MYSSTLLLTFVLNGGRWSMPQPGRFTPGKEIQCPLYRKLCGSQSWSGWVWKVLPSTGLDPQTVQPVASCYTDYTILVSTRVWET